MSQNTDATALLMAARMLITDEADWVKGAYATTKSGKPIGALQQNACRFCSEGALAASHGQHFGGCYLDAESRLRSAMGGVIAEFNDNHTHSEVLAAFDRAIEGA